MATRELAPHGVESLEWSVPGGGPSATRKYAATVPAELGVVAIALRPETASECARAAFELAVAARVTHGDPSHAAAASSLLVRAEALASSLVDGTIVSAFELAKNEAGLPSTRARRLAGSALEAVGAHGAAARRALGLGAIAAAHTAPSTAPGKRRARNYRTVQTWLDGSDLWPTGAEYVPPQPERVPALMDDLVEFCARTDVDPIAQAAVAHAQFLSIQPFDDANGRAARFLINGVWRRRGVTESLVVPISASIAGDRRRYDSAWRAYREGDADPMVSFVARHALLAVREATASADRVALMPRAWSEAARPRRQGLLGAHALLADEVPRSRHQKLTDIRAQTEVCLVRDKQLPRLIALPGREVPASGSGAPQIDGQLLDHGSFPLLNHAVARTRPSRLFTSPHPL